LGQIDVTADGHWTDDGIVETYPRVVANDDVANGMINTGKRLDDRMGAKAETAVGWRVHPNTPVNLRTTTTMLVQRSYQPHVPTGTCIALIHDQIV
jgi:hypothetical protein